MHLTYICNEVNLKVTTAAARRHSPLMDAETGEKHPIHGGDPGD